MTYLDHKDRKHVILNIVKDAIITNGGSFRSSRSARVVNETV